MRFSSLAVSVFSAGSLAFAASGEEIGSYCSTTTQRGYEYSYFHKQPSEDKPSILFLHGFPSTAQDWSAQIEEFSSQGYGIIAPDLLGYGNTSAPDDVAEYRTPLLVQDVIDVLDAAGADQVIGVAHDWGSLVLSRMLNLHIDRFAAAAFLALGYSDPSPDFDFYTWIESLNKRFGYDVFGYMEFFGADDGPTIIEENLDSFYTLFFPGDPYLQRTDLAPLGKARAYIEANTTNPLPPYMSPERAAAHQHALLQKGLVGPCNYYKNRVNAGDAELDATIPEDAYIINIPTFFGGALLDYSCRADLDPTIGDKLTNLTTVNFNTAHWIMLEAPDELNEALTDFFNSL